MARRTNGRPGRCTRGRPSRASSGARPGSRAPARRSPASIPSHIAGATAGRATRFAASDPTETVPKWCAIRGAVATVAAMLIAVPSASALRGDPGGRPPSSSAARRRVHRKIPTTAAKLSCQPMSEHARGSSARVSDRREQQRVPARAGPAGERRHEPGGAHRAGALDRGAGARDRHVESDQGEQHDQPGAQRQAHQREERPREQAEEDHVLAAHREQVREPRALEVLAGARIDRVVLAEDEPAGEGGLALGHAPAEGGLGPLADRVDPAGEPAAPLAGRLDAIGLERHRDAVAARASPASNGSGWTRDPVTRTPSPAESPSSCGERTSTRPCGVASCAEVPRVSHLGSETRWPSRATRVPGGPRSAPASIESSRSVPAASPASAAASRHRAAPSGRSRHSRAADPHETAPEARAAPALPAGSGNSEEAARPTASPASERWRQTGFTCFARCSRGRGEVRGRRPAAP